MKNFKLKSRSTYQNLAAQEKDLMAEISALEDKFEAWALEDESKPARAPKSKLAMGAPRVSSVQNRQS